MKEYLYLFSTLICLCFFSCAGTGTKNNSTGEATIPVAHERLYLAPLISEAGLEKLPSGLLILFSRKFYSKSSIRSGVS